MNSGWLTNDPAAAAAFKRADWRYARERNEAMNLRLADKVVALAAAKEKRDAAYSAISRGETA